MFININIIKLLSNLICDITTSVRFKIALERLKMILTRSGIEYIRV